jgi:hypothetical protein
MQGLAVVVAVLAVFTLAAALVVTLAAALVALVALAVLTVLTVLAVLAATAVVTAPRAFTRAMTALGYNALLHHLPGVDHLIVFNPAIIEVVAEEPHTS